MLDSRTGLGIFSMWSNWMMRMSMPWPRRVAPPGRAAGAVGSPTPRPLQPTTMAASV